MFDVSRIQIFLRIISTCVRQISLQNKFYLVFDGCRWGVVEKSYFMTLDKKVDYQFSHIFWVSQPSLKRNIV